MLSTQVIQRFILGRQGLWPGRRWAGQAGAAEALRAVELVQMDPLNIVARSHELVLHSRVADYQLGDLDALMYRDRLFFDHGGWLCISPMAELPYWRPMMRAQAARPRWAALSANAPLLRAVRAELRRRGPLGSRDLELASSPATANNYRGSKDTGIALYYLWLRGELMTHHRRHFDRIFDFRQQIAPPALDRAAPLAQAERYLVIKQIAFVGLCRERGFGGMLERTLSRAETARWRKQLLAQGAIVAFDLEGRSEPYYALAADLPLVEALQAGEVPPAWQPLGPSTLDEVTFLAPLDIVSARGRSKLLFGFEYIWEVYKPADKRRFGYYTLPILYGDQLVARLDPVLDRASHTLVIKGLWFEDPRTARDAAFAHALGRGLARLMRCLSATHLDVSALQPAALRRKLQSVISSAA